MKPPTAQYRLMTYFAHSTLVLYSASVSTRPSMSVAEFLEENRAACERVHQEALTIFEYELSHQQMGRAAHAYMAGVYHPQKVEETEAFQL